MILFYSLVVQMVKNLPAMQETQLQSLGQEDSPKKEMATHSSMFAWEIPWIEEPDGLQSMGLQKSQTQLSALACKHAIYGEARLLTLD